MYVKIKLNAKGFFNHVIIIVYSMRGSHSYFKIKVKHMQHKIKQSRQISSEH